MARDNVTACTQVRVGADAVLAEAEVDVDLDLLPDADALQIVGPILHKGRDVTALVDEEGREALCADAEERARRTKAGDHDADDRADRRREAAKDLPWSEP